MIPAIDSYVTISTELNKPKSETCPYIPDNKYASASPIVIIIPNSFCED